MKNKIILFTVLFFMGGFVNILNATLPLGHSRKHYKKIPMKTQYKFAGFEERMQYIKSVAKSYVKNVIDSPKKDESASAARLISNITIDMLGSMVCSGVSVGLNKSNFGAKFNQEQLMEECSKACNDAIKKIWCLDGEDIDDFNFSLEEDSLKQFVEKLSTEILTNKKLQMVEECLNNCVFMLERCNENNDIDPVSGNGSDPVKINGEQHVDEQELSMIKSEMGEHTGFDQNSFLNYVQDTSLNIIADIEQGLVQEMNLGDSERSGFWQNIRSGFSTFWSRYLHPKVVIGKVFEGVCSVVMSRYVYGPLIVCSYALLVTLSACIIVKAMQKLGYDDRYIVDVLRRLFRLPIEG